MQLLKKYSAMLVPVGITLAALVLIVATILMGGSLKTQMAASSKQAATIKQLLSSPLSDKQWEVEKTYEDAHQKDAEAIAAYGSQSSQRELLSYAMFPAPEANETSNTLYHNFAKTYSQAIDKLVSRMRGGQPHTQAEIAMATRSGMTSGSAANLKEQMEQECLKRARSMGVYAGPYAFAGYDYGSSLTVTNRDRALAQCWFWQVAYWVQEDIADTIVAVNAASKDELESPVKRLIAISFAAPDASLVVRAGRTGGSSGPSIGTGGAEGAFMLGMDPEAPKYFVTGMIDNVAPTGSLTGRVTNEDIDVVHFTFAVVMRSSSLMPFVKQLCSEKKHVFKGFDGKAAPQELVHNQITVIGGSVSPVDVTVDETLNYRYGTEALYKVNFVCEYIFSRSGYDAIKPAIVKNPPAATTN
jgi:hypothetical protein